MSYKILLVDDEPIILSGIKFLLDWPAYDCEIIETARNGQEALERLPTMKPDIVLCDINMPVMDGIRLLEAAHTDYPHIVFVMLTNLEDFDLVRRAMQLRALNYLLKSQLEPQALAAVLLQAIDEVKKRTALSRSSLSDSLSEKDAIDLIRDTLCHSFQSSEFSQLPQFINTLQAHHTLHHYGAMQLFFDFSKLPQYETFTQEEENRLFAWQQEIAQKIATNFFKQTILVPTNQQNNALLLFAWNNSLDSWQQDTETFAQRLSAASANVTQCEPGTLATRCFVDGSTFATFHQEVFALRDYYYAANCKYAYAAQLPEVYLDTALHNRYSSLSLNGISTHLMQKLQTKDARGCHLLIEKAMQQILTTYHHRNQATWVCRELYDAFYQYANSHPTLEQSEDSFYQYNVSQRRINQSLSQEKMIAWLQQLQFKIDTMFEKQFANKPNTLDKACEYIQANADKRILLQDIASHAAISPSYLSTLFKKTFHKSIVDYINETKIHRACTLIEEEKFLIYEISSKLGFDNAYYFTKVFKRYTGITPTEYQAKWKTEHCFIHTKD